MRRWCHLGVTVAALTAAGFAGEAAIVPVREGDRIIFKNNESVPPPTVAQADRSGEAGECESTAPRRYIYWSNTEKRWKRVPAPSRLAIRNACSAVREVTAAISAAPQAANAQGKQKLAPDTLSLTYGRSISQAQLDSLITDAALRHNVDANLVRSLIRVESNFNARAISRKGALGLMQLMPATARDLNVRNPLDPAQNVDGGVRHLKGLLETFHGDVELSLAAYNAGAGTVKRKGGVPNYKETKEYVRRITDLYGSGNALTSGRSQIRVTYDADGHRVFTND